MKNTGGLGTCTAPRKFEICRALKGPSRPLRDLKQLNSQPSLSEISLGCFKRLSASFLGQGPCLRSLPAFRPVERIVHAYSLPPCFLPCSPPLVLGLCRCPSRKSENSELVAGPRVFRVFRFGGPPLLLDVHRLLVRGLGTLLSQQSENSELVVGPIEFRVFRIWGPLVI